MMGTGSFLGVRQQEGGVKLLTYLEPRIKKE